LAIGFSVHFRQGQRVRADRAQPLRIGWKIDRNPGGGRESPKTVGRWPTVADPRGSVLKTADYQRLILSGEKHYVNNRRLNAEIRAWRARAGLSAAIFRAAQIRMRSDGSLQMA
jgi:hypothetical protein